MTRKYHGYHSFQTIPKTQRCHGNLYSQRCHYYQMFHENQQNQNFQRTPKSRGCPWNPTFPNYR